MLMNTGIKLSPFTTRWAGWGEEDKSKGQVIPANLQRQIGDFTVLFVYRCATLLHLYFPVSIKPSIQICVPVLAG